MSAGGGGGAGAPRARVRGPRGICKEVRLGPAGPAARPGRRCLLRCVYKE